MERPWGVPTKLVIVLAVAALVTTGLCPRGMLRAAAASELDESVFAQADAPTLATEADDDIDLPGVRALVAREESDATEFFRHIVLAAAVVLEAGTHGGNDDAGEDFPDDPSPVTDAPRVRPCGDRAPPLSI